MDGIRHKPLWIRVLSAALWLNTFGMPLQAMVFFGHAPVEVIPIWAKLTPQNKLVMALSPLAALGVQRVTPLGYAAALLFWTAALLNNLVLLRFHTPVPPRLVALSTALTLGGVGWFLRPSTVCLYRSTHLHWWKPAPRYRVSAPVELEKGGRPVGRGTLFDLSRTGCYVAAGEPALEAGDLLTLCIRFEQRAVRCLASVVRSAVECTTYPEGVGLRFEGVRLVDRIWLRRNLGRLDSV